MKRASPGVSERKSETCHESMSLTSHRNEARMGDGPEKSTLGFPAPARAGMTSLRWVGVDAVPKKLSSQARGRSHTPVHRYCRWLGG
jgi:hypothetical protein